FRSKPLSQDDRLRSRFCQPLALTALPSVFSPTLRGLRSVRGLAAYPTDGMTTGGANCANPADARAINQLSSNMAIMASVSITPSRAGLVEIMVQLETTDEAPLAAMADSDGA